MAVIYPVIMSGGAGTRLWPLSRKQNPKQYHALVNENTLFENTVKRVHHQGDQVANPIIICANGHQDQILDQCKHIGITPQAIILEPFGRNTAAVAAIASQYVKRKDPTALVLLMPADHHVDDLDGFWACVNKGVNAAKNGNIITLGIHAATPETGYGYIKRGAAIDDDVYHVDRFVEKPDRVTAQKYINEGTFSWNAGIFLFSAASMLDELDIHAASIKETSIKALDAALKFDQYKRCDVQLLNADIFVSCQNEPIDIAIMEKTDHAAIVTPVDVGWNDIGAWPAVRDASIAEQNKNNNSNIDVLQIGDVSAINCKNSYIRSEGIKVAALGVEDLVIVATDDAILITKADHAQDVKKVIAELKNDNRLNLL